jgi:hypothetical protein
MGSIKRRGAVVALAVAIVVAAAALAVAAGKGPKTDATHATFTAQQTDSKARTCTGEDGTYSATRERFAGTITGDAPISGDLLVKSRALVNQATGLGTSRGTVRILDPATKHVKAHGKFSAVVTEGGVLNGFLSGHVRSRGEDPPRRDGRLWANFRAQVTEQGAVTGELGGGASQNTAVIQSGKCGAPAKQTPKPKKDKKDKPKPKR